MWNLHRLKKRLGAREDRPEPTQLPLEPRKLQAQAFICRDVRIPYFNLDVYYYPSIPVTTNPKKTNDLPPLSSLGHSCATSRDCST